MKQSSGDVRYTPSENVAYRNIEGQILILQADDDVLRTFNTTGAFVWTRLVKKHALSRIVGALATEYGIERERAAADVEAFLADLKKRGIIRPAGR
jgi:hypothetical protein